MEHAAFSESGGMVLNYVDMPEALLDTVFPNHFGLPVGKVEREMSWHSLECTASG